MYQLFKNLLFQFPPEISHSVALNFLRISKRLSLSKFLFPTIHLPTKVMGITFPNPIGLAAGLDKNGDYCDSLAAIGFGFIEIGTITPKPQAGNPKPRLFRLIPDEALINRMGFNNKGVDYVVSILQQKKLSSILGINIGKNKETPNDQAFEDYVYCFKKLWRFADYITVNVSSPNTPNLRELQDEFFLTTLFDELKKEQATIAKENQKYVPLVVKISPDLTDADLNKICRVILERKIDAVIATNTTLSRNNLKNNQFQFEQGGLSGKPLSSRSTEVIRIMHNILGHVPIIASGGVMDRKTAEEKIKAGASLLQIYTGFIYHGPKLIRDIANVFKV